jgi:hypothetical protein
MRQWLILWTSKASLMSDPAFIYRNSSTKIDEGVRAPVLRENREMLR